MPPLKPTHDPDAESWAGLPFALTTRRRLRCIESTTKELRMNEKQSAILQAIRREDLVCSASIRRLWRAPETSYMLEEANAGSCALTHTFAGCAGSDIDSAC
jgi:hypothetical protein